ncbi:peptidylprolyl isomerase [archaeon]|nr:peptidylprolyl isomerase [archaeon]
MAIKTGDKVKLEYEGTFDDGTVFDSSTHGDHSHPIEFEVGAGQVIQGLDKEVVGMKKGEEKEIKVQPSEAYGKPKSELVKKLPREQLPENVKQGMILGLKLPDGKTIPARVVKLTSKEATIDLNHPLAGKVLNFKIKVVSVN